MRIHVQTRAATLTAICLFQLTNLHCTITASCDPLSKHKDLYSTADTHTHTHTHTHTRTHTRTCTHTNTTHTHTHTHTHTCVRLVVPLLHFDAGMVVLRTANVDITTKLCSRRDPNWTEWTLYCSLHTGLCLQVLSVGYSL